MKKHLLPSALLCMVLTAMTASGDPGNTFYEANLSLTRAARLEKEGDYKAALENGKKAAELLQSMKKSAPEWNPSWVDGKLDAATQLRQRVETLAQKNTEHKKQDYSLKPGEWRDVTMERAYKAHARQKMVTAVTSRPVTVAAGSPAPRKTAAPAAGRTEIRVIRPSAAPVPFFRSAPSRGLPPRTERDGRFRIGN